MTMSTPLYKLPSKMLGDLTPSRSIEKVLQDASLSRGLQVEDLGPGTLTEILKHDIYKRMLLNVAPIIAKKRIVDVLSEVAKAPEDPAGRGTSQNPVADLEQASKRFALYFDWPEAQRLRGVLGIARTEGEAGRNITPLVQEGQDLIAQMERRLDEGLVQQAQELAELKAVFTRVQPLGGKEVRRLESLIGQIEEAHAQGVLLPAELERARNISFKLRKSMESSMMQVADPEAASPDAQARLLALEQEHVARKLTALQRDYQTLLKVRPELEQQYEDFKKRQSNGMLSETAVDAWRESLETAKQKLLGEQRDELIGIAELLGSEGGSEKLREARMALDVARLTLQSGGLATEQLRELRMVAQALSHSPEMAERVVEGQRELAEIERSVRDVPGAAEALAEMLSEARAAVENGQEYNFTALWSALERQMGTAAVQRQDFDARADFVIAEYDEVRSLAGETIQRLGRLADALRAQRRLGPMSAEARERYAQTLTEAESLLGEAHAEYEAAQKVTATFGEEALDGLLDVFDFGGDTLEEAADSTASAARNPTMDDWGALLAPDQGSAADTDGDTEAAWNQMAAQVQPPAAAEPEPELAPERPETGNPAFLLSGLSASAPATAPEPAAVSSAPENNPFASLLNLGGHSPTPAATPSVPQPEVEATAPELVAPSGPAPLALRSGARAHIWQIRQGEVLAGSGEIPVAGMAELLRHAEGLGLTRLDTADKTQVWSARWTGSDWRLAAAPDWDSLDDDAGAWLDTGEL